MQKEFLLAGFGGQGVMFAGQLLAYAALDEGLEVTWIPSYGPEMRGGTAHCFVVISDRRIGSPVVRHPKVVIAFNNPSFIKYEPLLASGGLLAFNASLTTQHTARTDITMLAVPAVSIADNIGNIKVANMAMLGAVLAVYPAVSLDAVRRALENHISAHRKHTLPANFEALAQGAAFASTAIKQDSEREGDDAYSGKHYDTGSDNGSARHAVG